jgi:4-amino-4-deoxy-L-arabinose transferase-like glycosyltransferase
MLDALAEPQRARTGGRAVERMTDRGRFLVRLSVITAIAAVGRVVYSVAVADPRVRDIELSDQVFYHLQARAVADGWGFVNPFAFYASGDAHRIIDTALHPPLYSTFLAAPARLGIDSMLSQRVITSLLGAATVFLVGLLGRKIGGNRVGLLTAGIAAIAPALWVNDSVLGLETLYCFLVVLALLALYSFWDRPRVSAAIGLAAALGLASLTRSEGPILFVLLAVPTVLLKHGLSWRDRTKYLGAMALVGALLVGPWVVRNLTTFDEPTYLGTGFGLVLAYGNCDQTYSGELLGYWYDQCGYNEYKPRTEESVVDLRAREKGVDYLRDHLSRLPVVVAARVGRVWSVFRPAQNVELDAFYERRGTAESWAVLVAYYAMLVLSIAGLVVLRRRRIPIFPYVAIALSVTITVALSFGITRYRAPVDVVMPLLSAVAIDAFLRWRRNAPGTPGEPGDPLECSPSAPDTKASANREAHEGTSSLPG